VQGRTETLLDALAVHVLRRTGDQPQYAAFPYLARRVQKHACALNCHQDGELGEKQTKFTGSKSDAQKSAVSGHFQGNPVSAKAA